MSLKTSEKSLFKSKIGLIAATVGSAVGLGTVWRFPAETQANGGGAFLIVYIACVFLLGVPVMLSEFCLGRASRSDAVGTFSKLSPGTQWWVVGALAVLASYLINCFYMVVGGWTLEYLIHSIDGDIFAGLNQGGAAAFFQNKMHSYVESDMGPLVNTLIVILLNGVILILGVQKGIERMSNVMMPLLFVLLAVFCGFSLSLDKASEGLEYFLSPDFSKITPSVCINALGQALFSLSLGMGILITYASYFPSNTKLIRTSSIVSSMTLMVALLMGFIIFPAVFSFGLQDHGVSGTTLVFITMPEIFASMPFPQIWAIAFFTLLLIAAITSTVSIAEVTVAFLQKRFSLSRKASVIWVIAPLLVFGGICSLSFGSLSDATVFDLNIFKFLDLLTNNYMLPVVALGCVIYAGWFAPKALLQEQLSNGGKLKNRLIQSICFIIKWVAPVAILLTLITNLI